MYKHVLSHIIAALFIGMFLAPKIASLHTLSHLSDHDDPISCEIFDFIVDLHQFDFIDINNLYVESGHQNTPNVLIINTNYNSPQDKIVSPTNICNRPPPFA